MTEAGGPSAHAGIYYQNSIAALYMGRMLDLRARPARDRVVKLRVEAPEEVDDIVVHLGDGSRRFIQAKRTISISSDKWNVLWISFAQQMDRPGINFEDRLRLVIGEHSTLAKNLRDCCERTISTDDDSEYFGRLTSQQRSIVDSIVSALSARSYDLSAVRRLLARTDVEIVIGNSVERDHAPLWMPQAPISPVQLLGVLRDIAGGASRVRGSFDAPTLRARLKEEHCIELPEPGGWGSGQYREVMLGRAVIEVPGTDVVKRIADGFMWPKITRYDRNRRADFEDEIPYSTFGVRSDEIDISLFPVPGVDRVVVIAGPGFGKSVLVRALAARAAEDGRLPVIVPIPELATLDVEVGEYLREHLNKAFEVSIDWGAAAESGLLVLFLDGLDEVSSDRRAVLLERVKTFCLRYPATPWMLTVRDAAALSAPTDALLLEVQPLDYDSIKRLIAFYKPDDPSLPERLLHRFDRHPDLQRLVRIPLFLAILLASTNDLDSLPTKRTELIELYLDLLFRPEQFKPSQGDTVDGTILRPIVEAVAFEALEREEIGVSARLLEATARHFLAPGMSLQPIIEKLVKCGVLRRTTPGRYEFPFPIIQEYLAAHHMFANQQHRIPERFLLSIKRPWAQALQFVLELHPAPGNLVDELLAIEDDAFSTNLRLIARCVANGMAILPAMREEIARRLATIWPRSSWRVRSRIGDLISDAFYVPLVPEIRAQLSNRGLLHDGVGSIVTRINDRELTLSVLRELLEGDVEYLLNLGDLQAPVSILGDDALNLYTSHARAPSIGKEELNAMASLIGHLDGRLVPDNARLSVALDEELPYQVRLAAFALGPTPLDQRAYPLIQLALGMEDYQSRSLAIEAIVKTDDSTSMLRQAFLRVDISQEGKIALIGYFSRALPEGRRASTLRAFSRDMELSAELRWPLLVLAARYGDRLAMTELIDHLDRMPFNLIGTTISIFGHHRSRQMVESTVQYLRKQDIPPERRVELTASAVLGMTALYEMDSLDSGLIKSVAPHPGLAVFQALLEEWGARNDYAPLNALRMDEQLVLIGSELAIERLPDRISQVLEATDINLEDYDHAHTIGSALRTLRERHRLLSLPFLETIIARCSYNAASSAVEMIAARGTREDFDSLLSVYESVSDPHLKLVVLDKLELLAGRLGLRVRKEGHGLRTDCGRGTFACDN